MLFCMAKNLAFPEILTIAFNSGMYLQVSAVYLLWNAIQKIKRRETEGKKQYE